MEKKTFNPKLWLTLVFALFVLVTLGRNCCEIAYPGEGAIKTTLGTVHDETFHGLVLKWPIIEEVIKYNTKQQTQSYEELKLKTKDIQNVYLSCSVIYQINDENLPNMVKNVNMDNYINDILTPRVENAVLETIGKNDVWLLITEMDMIREATRYIISDQLSTDNYIIIKDILFKDPDFDAQFKTAILDKLTEEVLLERAKIQTQKVEQEALQALAMASVEPKVAELMNKAISNPLIIKYEAMKALNNWDGKLTLPNTLVTGTDAMPIIGTK